MRYNLGRVIRAVLFSTTGFLVCVAFQNCSGYAADNNPLYDNASVETCVGLTCEQDANLLRLSIGNDDPVAVKTGSVTASSACGVDDSSCIDLGGSCDTGGYDDSVITYSISGGTVQQAETALSAKCIDGRFRAQVPLPVGYDFANVHVVRLTIYGLDGGTRVPSPAGANYREVSIAAYN